MIADPLFFPKSVLRSLDPSIRLDNLSSNDIASEFREAVNFLVEDFCDRATRLDVLDYTEDGNDESASFWDCSDAEYQTFDDISDYIREDARWKPGFHWVGDPSVKGNGYWRKNQSPVRQTATARKTREKNTRITAKIERVAQDKHGLLPTTNKPFARSQAEERGIMAFPVVRPIKGQEDGFERGFKSQAPGSPPQKIPLNKISNEGVFSQHKYAETGGLLVSVARGTKKAVAMAELDTTDAVKSEAKNAKSWTTNLFGKKSNWEWIEGERETSDTKTNKGKDSTPALISVSTNLSGDHYYSLEFDTGETVSKLSYFDIETRTKDPKNTFGAAGQLVLGKPVAIIRTLGRKKIHPVYDRIQVQPKMSDKDPHVVRKLTETVSATKTDSRTTKRVVNWQGLSIGVTDEPGDRRFTGLLTIPMQRDVSYGHIRRSYPSAPDKKALDVYYSHKNTNNLFKIRQLTVNGMVDEPKYCVGFETIEAARDAYLAHAGRDRFGGIEPVDITELTPYRVQKYHQDTCDCEKCILVRERKKRKRKKTSVQELEEVDRTDAPGTAEQSSTDLADLIVEQAIASSAPAINRWTNQIISWFDSVESLDEARDRVNELYDGIDDKKFVNILYEQRVLADLGGRLEILEEVGSDDSNSKSN